MKYVIKAAFLDKIELLQHRRKSLLNLHSKKIGVEQDLNDIKKDDLIKLLQNIDNYCFEDNYLIYNRSLTPSEIAKEKEDINKGIEYDVFMLKKWCASSKENETQILSYLKRHNMNVIGIN